MDQQQLDRILASLHARPEQCVDEATYKQRLAICHTCPSLAYDTTCMHCGCLVAVRALLKNQPARIPGRLVGRNLPLLLYRLFQFSLQLGRRFYSSSVVMIGSSLVMMIVCSY